MSLPALVVFGLIFFFLIFIAIKAHKDEHTFYFIKQTWVTKQLNSLNRRLLGFLLIWSDLSQAKDS